MKKLFLSFTGLLSLITSQQVTAEELGQGLFYFGCTRGHAYQPGAQGEFDERTLHQGKYQAAHPVLVAALTQAEHDGRAVWRNRQAHPYDQLNALLAYNGYAAIDAGADWMGSYPEIRDRVQAAGIALDVQY